MTKGRLTMIKNTWDGITSTNSPYYNLRMKGLSHNNAVNYIITHYRNYNVLKTDGFIKIVICNEGNSIIVVKKTKKFYTVSTYIFNNGNFIRTDFKKMSTIRESNKYLIKKYDNY